MAEAPTRNTAVPTTTPIAMNTWRGGRRSNVTIATRPERSREPRATIATSAARAGDGASRWTTATTTTLPTNARRVRWPGRSTTNASTADASKATTAPAWIAPALAAAATAAAATHAHACARDAANTTRAPIADA